MTDQAVPVNGEVRMLIDGELVEAASGRRFNNVNPATEEVLGEVADAGKDDMQRAIAASRRAFDETKWATDRALRKRCLEQLHAAIDAEREDFRAELVAEVGAPIAITYGPQLDAPLEEGLLWPAKMIDEFPWERDLGTATPFGMPSHRYVWKEPVGVVGSIIPWNFPFEITLNKLGQVLATGKRIMEKGAATLKRVFLELGGKSATIVLDDADFSSVLMAAGGICMHAGQGCAIQTRLLVPRERYDEAIALLQPVFENIPYGDPTDPSNIAGPVISEKQRERVLGYIKKGVDEGARLVVGGGKPAHLPKGWFVEPTLFADVDNSMTIAQEEIFGPVLVVIAHDGDDDGSASPTTVSTA